ncbi:amidohydrolase [bacterium]|nr:amidohydrolase [bacterium]
MSEIRKAAEEIKDKLIQVRRDFHKYPEIGFQEKRTSKKIAEILDAIGLDVKTNIAKTGVVGLLKGGYNGKTVALRADMDALNVNEKNAVSYISRNKGIMHACGHDGHMSMVIGTAIVLSRFKKQIHGNVKFIFQPAEENIGGAELMIKDGVLKNPHVDAIFALHLWPYINFGNIGVRAGAMMASMDNFSIIIKGKGGHGAMPHTAVDPLIAANSVFQALQTIKARNIDALDPFVISVCSINGGASYNIIPDEVEMKGTFRTLNDKTRNKVKKRMVEIMEGIAKSFGVKYTLCFEKGYPVTVNNASLVNLMVSSAKKLDVRVIRPNLSMVSEDFSFYQKEIPGVYFWLGVKKDKNPVALHNGNFNFDEDILPVGTSLLAECALGYLSH